MRSSEILIHFPPINLEKPLAYLNNFPLCSLYEVIRDFTKLSEKQMVSYTFPKYVSEKKERILNSRYGKDSVDFKDFNTVVTSIIILKSCAKLNLAIYALRDKYLEAESKRPRYSSSYDSYSSGIWFNSTDEDVLKIKNSAILVRDNIHNYSKKYTVDGFEEEFVNKIKYSVYAICNRFFVETRTLTERATDTGASIIGYIVAFIIFCFLFWLLVQCACD